MSKPFLVVVALLCTVAIVAQSGTPAPRATFKSKVNPMTDKPSCKITAPLGRDVLFISSSSETWGDTGVGFMVAFSGGRTAYGDGGSLRIGQDEAKGLRRLGTGDAIALVGDPLGTMQIVHGLLSGKRVLIQWLETRSGKEVTQAIPKYAGLEAAYAQGVKLCGWPDLDQ